MKIGFEIKKMYFGLIHFINEPNDFAIFIFPFAKNYGDEYSSLLGIFCGKLSGYNNKQYQRYEFSINILYFIRFRHEYKKE